MIRSTLLLLALVCAWPLKARAKACDMRASLELISAAGNKTIFHRLPNAVTGFQAPPLCHYGQIRLLPGDQLRFVASPLGSFYECSAAISRNGIHLASLPANGSPLVADATQPGLYTAMAGGTSGGAQFSFEVVAAAGPPAPINTGILVSLVMQGARSGTSYQMRVDLANQGLIPCQEPYTAMGFPASSSGSETIDGCQDLFVQRSIADWVHIDLVDAQQPSLIVASRNGLLHHRGDVLDIDGISPLAWTVPMGEYRIRITHRNHLPILTDQAIALRGGTVFMPVTIAAESWSHFMTYPSLPAITCDGQPCAMPQGNTLIDSGQQRISYLGNNNDRDPILVRIGGSNPTNVLGGYFLEDVNLDGWVKYVGANNDRDAILQQLNGDPLGVLLGPQP